MKIKINKKYNKNYSDIVNYFKSVKEDEFIDNLPEILNIESGHEIVSMYCTTNIEVFINNLKYISEYYLKYSNDLKEIDEFIKIKNNIENF